MAMKLAPGLVDSIAAKMAAELAAVLDAEELIWADGIELAPPNAIIKRWIDNPQKFNNPPYLYVVVPRTQIYDWRDGYAESTHQLDLMLIAQDSDPEKLRKIIYRYGNALWKELVSIDGDVDVPHRMALPGSNIVPEFNFMEPMTRGSVAITAVQLTTYWSVTENES